MTLTEQTNTTWDDERIETLRALWTDGQSARQISEVLGCSRNAIIGKSHRLGLSRSHNPSSAPKSRDQKANNQTRAARPAPTQSAPPILSPLPKYGAGNKTLLELRHDDCRWPIGETYESARMFCGNRVVPGKSYCSEHWGSVYVKTSQRVR